MEKILIVIDNRNSLIVKHEYPATNSEEAAKVLNNLIANMHKQDQIISIETI